MYILTLWRSDWSTLTVTPFLPGLESGASTPISMMQRLSLTFVEGSDSVSLGAAVGKVPPGINRTSKELPLLLLSLLLLSLISVSLLLLLMLHLLMREPIYLALVIDLRFRAFVWQDQNEKGLLLLGLFWLVPSM